MKKVFFFALAFIFIVGMLWIPQATTIAQATNPTSTPTPYIAQVGVPTAQATVINPFPDTPELAQLERGENISFRVLDTTDTAMIGPYASYYLNVGIPSHWKVTREAKLTLKVNLNITRPPDQEGNFSAWLGPRLDIFFDDVFITSVRIPDNGDYSFDIYLPVNQMKAAKSGAHYLYLYLDAAYDCEFEQSSVVTIKADSFFTLPHESIVPTPNLNNLPVPFFQRSSFLPNQVTLIVPDNPTVGELQAAMIVAAGFGRMTTETLEMVTLPAGQVTDAIMKASHLIYVGKAGSIPAVSALSLPAPVKSAAFDARDANISDGILQMVGSKINTEKVVLVVGGNSDEGVIKAAKAVSTGTVRATQNSKLAIITNVSPENVSTTSVPIDRTLASLGYKNVTMEGLGLVSSQYEFMLPGGFSVGPDAYLDLIYTHSGLLDEDRSSISVFLNGIQVNSAPYDKEVRLETTKPYHFALPAYAFKPGVNTLVFQSNHVNEHCAYYTDGEIWTTIYNSSLLHVPPSEKTEKTAIVSNFANYPRPFTDDPNLETIAMVISRNDPSSLYTAGKIAEDFGRQTPVGIIDLQATYSDAVTEEMKKDKSLILVGKPADIPLVTELIEYMPAPFSSGSNIADESSLSVSYRIAADASIGYIEIFKSPWNPDRVIMAALGSNTEGVRWVANALTKPEFVTLLLGNYVVTNGSEVYGVDTDNGSGTMNIGVTAAPVQAQTVIPNSANLPAAAPVSASTETNSIFNLDPKVWVPYAIVIISAITVLVLIIIIAVSLKKRRDENYRIHHS